MNQNLFGLSFLLLVCLSCNPSIPLQEEPISFHQDEIQYIEQQRNSFQNSALQAPTDHLHEADRQALSLFIEAAKIMDTLFMEQAYGNLASLLNRIPSEAAREFTQINYGPWERLKNNEPFIPGFSSKPPGANLYPPDLTPEKWEAWQNEQKHNPYSMVRYNSAGDLQIIPYSQYFTAQLKRAAEILNQAANIVTSPELQKYLRLRAKAFLNDDYYPSDIAWMEMKNNPIDLVIGPIENYEDQLDGSRTAFEAYVLIKDTLWSQKLEKYIPLLPKLQKALPVSQPYKPELSNTNSEINAYDVLYYAGHANAGSKTIAINLPNDPLIQEQKGTRRLQLKNVIQEKYNHILLPIAQELLVPEQCKHLNFDAFFATIMFHEVAHGLGVKNLVHNPKRTSAEALGPHYAALEEGKADILGLFMIEALHQMGEIEQPMENYYITFLAGIFRSVRFGAASAHGMANMIRFNYFMEKKAFERNQDGKYRVNPQKMKEATLSLSQILLTIQGNGDRTAAEKLLQDYGTIHPQLQADLQRLTQNAIPVDLVFN